MRSPTLRSSAPTRSSSGRRIERRDRAHERASSKPGSRPSSSSPPQPPEDGAAAPGRCAARRLRPRRALARPRRSAPPRDRARRPLRRLYAPEAPLRHVSSLRGDGCVRSLRVRRRAQRARRQPARPRRWSSAPCAAPASRVEGGQRAELAAGASDRAVRAGGRGRRRSTRCSSRSIRRPSAQGALAAPHASTPWRPTALSHRTFVYPPRACAPSPTLTASIRRRRAASISTASTHFELERLPARRRASTASTGAAATQPGDERIFVLADVRGRSPATAARPRCTLPAFEHAFYEATRALRTHPRRARSRAPAAVEPHRVVRRRRLFLDPGAGRSGSRGGSRPATRHLGIEKVVVRLRCSSAMRPLPPRSRRGRDQRSHRAAAWRSASARRARNRSSRAAPTSARSSRPAVAGSSIPTRSSACSPAAATGPARAERRAPAGVLRGVRPRARRRAAARAQRRGPRLRRATTSAVVFGVIRTPTREGARGHGARARALGPDARHGRARPPRSATAWWPRSISPKRCACPVEWVPISSGARIAMDSGTENLDATARVVRRIVEFTQARRRDPRDRARA